MHQRLTAENTEKIGTFRLAPFDYSVELLGGEGVFTSVRHPASATGQITPLGHGNHHKGGEERLPPVEPSLETAYVRHTAKAEIADELPHKARCRSARHMQHSSESGYIHAASSSVIFKKRHAGTPGLQSFAQRFVINGFGIEGGMLFLVLRTAVDGRISVLGKYDGLRRT